MKEYSIGVLFPADNEIRDLGFTKAKTPKVALYDVLVKEYNVDAVIKSKLEKIGKYRIDGYLKEGKIIGKVYDIDNDTNYCYLIDTELLKHE